MEFVWNLCIPIRSRSRREPESQLEPQEEAEHRNATYKQEQPAAAAAASCRSASSCSLDAISMMADPVLLRLAAMTPSTHLRAAASSKNPTSLIFQIFFLSQ